MSIDALHTKDRKELMYYTKGYLKCHIELYTRNWKLAWVLADILIVCAKQHTWRCLWSLKLVQRLKIPKLIAL